MPELPEVSHYARIANLAAGKPVREARLSRPGLLSGIVPSRFSSFLRGQKITAIKRHGKFLLLGLSGKKWLAMHFGLSGLLSYEKKPAPAPGGSLDIVFSDGSRLRYRALFGRLDVVDDPREFVRHLGLGPDTLSLDWKSFWKLARSKNRLTVKAFLMDQKNIAGVGNLYSDESFFRTRIHPLTPLRDIGDVRLKKLFSNLVRILKTVSLGRRRGEWVFPGGYLAPHRERGERCPRCGTPLKMILIGGRKSFFCPKEQKL